MHLTAKEDSIEEVAKPRTPPHSDQEGEMGERRDSDAPEGNKGRNPTSCLQPANDGEGRGGKEEHRRNRIASHIATHLDNHAEMTDRNSEAQSPTLRQHVER